MSKKKLHPKSMPRQGAYYEATEEVLDIPGLAKLKSVMEKYNLSYVTLDHRLQVTVKRTKHYCPENDKRKEREKSLQS